MSSAAEQPDFITVKELASYLRVSLRTAYQLVYDGAVPATRVATVWRIPLAELDAQLSASAHSRGGELGKGER